MKIKLTDEQRLKMTAVFAAFNAIRSDKKLMKMMEYCQTTEIEMTAENEDDVMRLANFFEDVRDTAKYFDFAE
jgi:hypothetical protein